ncbi:MAG: LPP20 family lipoprotein [Hydrogenovibrio sp.]
MKPFLLFCFFSFALTGCVGQDVKPLSTTEKPTPDWFLNPPSDTTRQLYGVGEGRTREEAVQAALVDIAAKLSVQVSATFQSRLQVTQSTYEYAERTSEKQIQSQVAKIQLRDYQVERAERLGYGKTVALVGLDRQALFEDLRRQQDAQMQTLQTAESAHQKDGALGQYVFYRRSLDALADFRQRLLILETLQRDFDTRPYSDFLQRFEQRTARLKAEMRLVVTADDDTKRLVGPLQSALSQAGFQIAKTTRPGEKAQIRLMAEVAQSQAYGFYIERMALNIQALSDGVQIGGHKLNLKGQATHSFEQARENLTVKFQQQLQSQGLNAVIGVSFLPAKGD